MAARRRAGGKGAGERLFATSYLIDARLGINAPTGVLLYGPPGTGKTLLARAVAEESRAAFISCKLTDLVKGTVGASEKAVANLFLKAKRASPCVIFFDEVQAIFGARGESSNASVSMLAQFLAEMDEISRSSESRVVIIGATNVPSAMDSALLRPGRFENLVYAGLPTEESRAQILQLHSLNMPLNLNDANACL